MVMVVEMVSVVLAGAERTLDVIVVVTAVDVVSVIGTRVVVTAGAVETIFVVTEKYSTMPLHDTYDLGLSDRRSGSRMCSSET